MSDTATLTRPTVHLNGTSRVALRVGYSNAHAAVRAAIDAVQASAPHGRDYYTQGPDALRAAQQEHLSRVQRLEAVAVELADLAVALL